MNKIKALPWRKIIATVIILVIYAVCLYKMYIGLREFFKAMSAKSIAEKKDRGTRGKRKSFKISPINGPMGKKSFSIPKPKI